MTSSLGTAVVMGQGYVGLPVAMRAVDAGFDVVGFDLDQRKIAALVAATSYVEDITDAQLRCRPRLGPLPSHVRRRRPGRVRLLRHLGAHAAARGQPRSGLHRVGRRPWRPPTSGAAPRVILESTTYPGTTEELIAPILEAGPGLTVGADFHLGYSPERIDPGNVTYTLREHPQGRVGRRRRLPRRVQWFFDQLVDKTVAGDGHPRGRAHQAAREHVPPRQHRAGQRAGHLRPRTWASTCGTSSTRRTPSRSASCSSPRARAWAATACPSTRPTCRGRSARALGQTFRFVELANDVNNHMPDYVVQRIAGGAERAGAARQGPPRPRRSAWPTRPTPATPGRRRSGTSPRSCWPWAPRSPSPTRTWARPQLPDGAVAVELTADEVAAADAIAVLVDHADFDFSLLDGADAYVLDCRNVVDLEGVEKL